MSEYDHLKGEYEAGCGCGYPPAVEEDLKTFIPGVGFLITSANGLDSRIVLLEDLENDV